MNNNSMAAGYGYVRDPSALCRGSGCHSRTLIATADAAMAQTAELLEQVGREREHAMTMTPQGARPCQALWCEEGGHAFSERDPGMKVVVISGTDDSGAPVDESRTMCGGCAPQVNVRRTRPALAPLPDSVTAPAAAGSPWPAGYEVPGPADSGPRL